MSEALSAAISEFIMRFENHIERITIERVNRRMIRVSGVDAFENEIELEHFIEGIPEEIGF